MMKNNYIKQKRKDQNPVNHWKIFEGRLVFLLAMVILVVVAYTFILQQAYTKTALKTEIERDISSADAVHKLVNNRLGRKDFNEIKSKASANNILQVYNGADKPLYISTKDDIVQRASLILKDVSYVIEAHFEMTEKANNTDNPGKGDGSLYRKSTFWKNSIFSGYC